MLVAKKKNNLQNIEKNHPSEVENDPKLGFTICTILYPALLTLHYTKNSFSDPLNVP